jgi:tRNA pseudouridine synthase 10
MQAVAEEKRKGYRCVVWTAEARSQQAVQSLQDLSAKDVDEEGDPCLCITQLTPLRVLHRRSLLARKRCIYDIKVSVLNDHYFTLDIVTSAGTYVKEFVHGDFGRTEPSITCLLGCQCDILQLDVIKLYDDFSEEQKL